MFHLIHNRGLGPTVEISFSRLTVARVLITDYQTLNHEEKIKLNTTRGSAITEKSRAALRQWKYYGRFLTELLTRSSANTEEPCEHTVS